MSRPNLQIFVLALCSMFGLLVACGQPSSDRGEAAMSVSEYPGPEQTPAAAPEPKPEPALAEAHDDRLQIRLAEGFDAYPALARTIRAAADNHRREILAHAAAIAEEPDLPEPLRQWSLEVDYAPATGDGGLRVVAGDGYVYTGGAHGMPIIERYTYHVGQERILELSDWFIGDGIWTALSEHARADLIRQAEERHAEYGGEPETQGFWIEMIENGTTPDTGSFAIYEPILDPAGSVIGLRLIFPPYQVAPYVYGVQTVDVPTQIFLPWLTPDLVDLLADP